VLSGRPVPFTVGLCIMPRLQDVNRRVHARLVYRLNWIAAPHYKAAADLERVAVLLGDRHAWVCRPHVRKHQRRGDLARQPPQVLVVPACASRCRLGLHPLVLERVSTWRCSRVYVAVEVTEMQSGRKRHSGSAAHQAGVMDVNVHGVRSARGVVPSGLYHPMPKPSPE